jgi:biopolymer transport protein ExbB
MNVNKSSILFTARSRLSGLCVLVIVAAWVPCLGAEPVDFIQRLNDAIQQTDSELKAERIRIEEEEKVRQSNINRLRTSCREFADEIVELKLSIARKQAELQRVRAQREILWAERAQWREDRSQMVLVCREIERELAELLDLVPVSENRPGQLEQLNRLEGALADENSAAMIDSAFAVVASLLDEFRSTAAYSAEVVDPRGVRRPARLLRVGQNFFAYHIAGTDQIATAVSDPYGEGGYRWNEDLSEHMRRAILAAMDQAPNHAAAYSLPIDVTGAMTAATNLFDKTLMARIRSGGVVMFPLAAVAACLVLLICERLVVLLPETFHSLQFCRRALDMCRQGDFEQAEQLADRKKGLLPRTLRVCMAHRNSPPAVLDDAIQETFLHEFPKLERFLPSIRMLSSVAPILGLLGTVTGIIATFDVITVVGGGKPRLLAGGISEALITTAAGLIIAIPGLLAYSFLSGRINGIVAEAERLAAGLSNLIKQNQDSAKHNKDDNGSGKDGAAD